ncbi:MAG: CapA family protein [Clostridia bacterium]|nr:CapA family protein [Clostridia bacterium]
MQTKYLLLGADMVPTDSNFNLFVEGNTEALLGEELTLVLKNAEYRILNLEVPLTDRKEPVTKRGPHLIAPTATVQGMKQFHTDLVTLANNHILDQGQQGLQSTVNLLDREGIAHVGAGKDLHEAAEPYIFDFCGKKIGVYGCAEHEFSIAGQEKPGANPFDPFASMNHVRQLKTMADYVVVLYHGGKEHYRYPSPGLQKACRGFADNGADLIVCQHSHCIGCEEKYKHATIVYGQGNFIFDGSKKEYWQTSLLIRLSADQTVSYIPIRKEGAAVRLAEPDRAKEILSAFEERSKQILIPGFVEKNYDEFAQSYLEDYLRIMSGKRSVLFRGVNKLVGGRLLKSYLKKTYGTREMLGIANTIDCEAHRELLSQALQKCYRR